MYLETLLVSHCWVVHSFGLFCTVSGYDRGKHPPPQISPWLLSDTLTEGPSSGQNGHTLPISASTLDSVSHAALMQAHEMIQGATFPLLVATP